MFEFEKKCKETGLDEKNVREIENILLDNPNAGNVMQGTGGIRKLRYALSNKGKSSGARIIYVDFTNYEITYLITAYLKGETENLSRSEQNELKTLVRVLKAEASKRKGGNARG
jgi:hypothetical protein